MDHAATSFHARPRVRAHAPFAFGPPIWGDVALATLLLTALATGAAAIPEPVGLWTFDIPTDLTHADVGNDLQLVGTHEAVEGIDPSDGAARIDVGSYYICDHDIPGNGGGSLVNEFTLVMDVQTFGRGLWHCLLQTSQSNSNDGDVFISIPGQLGVSATGYAFPRMLDAKTWYRIAIVIDNGTRYEIHVDGIRVLDGTPQSIDGRFSLDPTALFFADDNAEDGEIDVSRIALYDAALLAEEISELGGLGGMDHFVTAPYLQNVKPDGISIMWESEALETAYVEYGADSTYGVTEAATAVDSQNQTWIYTAVLTGLDPGTTYHYRAVSGEFASPGRAFETAPAGEVDFSFAVWGDSQGYNHGDYDRDPTEPSKAMCRHMLAEGIDVAVNCGDLAENGGNYTDSRVFFVDRPITLLGGNDLPFFTTWGNHDGSSDAVIRKFTDLPSKDRGAPYHAGYGSYAFDYAGCHFICIDYLLEYDDIPGWVEEDLQSPEAQAATFTFLFVHRPPYIERWYNGQENLREDLVPLMEQYGVDVCFSGHMHGYNRGLQNDVYYCVTGGSSWLDHEEPLVEDWPHMTVGGYHNVAPDVDGGLIHHYVKVDVVGGMFTARMMAFYPDGTYREVLDTFVKHQGVSSTWEGAFPTLRLISPLVCPNPFRPGSWTSWAIGGRVGHGMRVALRIYSPTGRLVRTLVDEMQAVGRHRTRWDGRDQAGRPLPEGIYLLDLQAGHEHARAKAILIR
jgi:hypothetical protein